MNNPYQSPESPPSPKPERRGLFLQRVVRVAIAYLAISIMTLPLINSLWLGEIPLLTLFQYPKLPFAHWLRTDVVMPVIRLVGLSRGSFSPDYTLARIPALVLCYLLPLAALAGVAWWRTRFAKPLGRLMLILLVVAVVDGIFVIIFAGPPGLTIY